MQVKGSAVAGRKKIKCYFSLDGAANHIFPVFRGICQRQCCRIFTIMGIVWGQKFS